MRAFTRWSVLLALTVGGCVALNEWIIEGRMSGQLFGDPSEVPYNRTALVLGTIPVGTDGGPNRFFNERMAAAAALYCSGKVQHLILSGDEGAWGYNEPLEMRNALVALGVDPMDMTLDFAGFNTFESVLRAKEVFGQDQFTIVSQPFHNARALFIAHENGLEAVGFNAKDIPSRQAKRSWLRERGSRLKMWKYLMTGADARYIGETISLCSQVL